jgi:hypothetical protein
MNYYYSYYYITSLFYLLLVYLTILSVTLTMMSGIMTVNAELERMWKQKIMAPFNIISLNFPSRVSTLSKCILLTGRGGP